MAHAAGEVCPAHSSDDEDDGVPIYDRPQESSLVGDPLPSPPQAPIAQWHLDGSRLREFGAAHLAVIIVILTVGVVYAFSRMASAGGVAEPVPPPPSMSVSVEAPIPAPTPEATAEPIVVHVLGYVHAPGVVRLSPGARVAEAIEAAGGLREDADIAQLNLAARLDDGAQVIVGSVNEPAGEVRYSSGSSGGRGPAPPSAEPTLVNLNTASSAELETLPGVGPATAQRIIDYRTTVGEFHSVSELNNVDGIGPKTYQRLAPLVCV